MPVATRIPRQSLLAATVALLCLAPATRAQPALVQDARSGTLDEVVVTARKRQESLQDAPIAISALGTEQLATLGLAGLNDFSAGAIPALKVLPFPNNPSTLIVFIRGLGQTDSAQTTKEAAVGIYMDGVYLGRSQGLGTELADLERIEVLRGPQGALYGRNSTGGAVNLVTQKPTGELGLKQKLSFGKYDHFETVTQLNLPAIAGLSSKLSYLNSQRDGWVSNSLPGAADYNEERNEGYRIALRWNPHEAVEVDYSFDKSDVTIAQLYYQVGEAGLTGLPPEPRRQHRTRFPLALRPNATHTQGHALTATWNISEQVALKSITAHRKLDEKGYTNYGGTLGYSGLINISGIDQKQTSQELQLLGATADDRLDYVIGAYWYDEKASETEKNYGSVIATPGPPYSLGWNIFPFVPGTAVDRDVSAKSRSWALFSQVNWTPDILDRRLRLTLGARYTEDDKSGLRRLNGGQVENATFAVEGQKFDPTVTLNYKWTPTLSTYFTWANGYRSGGANIRSGGLSEYGEETIESFELGLKSELWDGRARLNAAAFYSEISDQQIDFNDPNNIVVSETINAVTGGLEVSGLEVELSVQPLRGLRLDLQYAYLDTTLPPQFNPLSGGYDTFMVPQTPRHSGSANLDYTLAPFSFGTLSFNLNYTASTGFYYGPVNPRRRDAYDIVDARLTLADIPLGGLRGNLQVSAWVKNLTDEEWVTASAYVENTQAVADAYMAPRTTGIDIQYQF